MFYGSETVFDSFNNKILSSTFYHSPYINFKKSNVKSNTLTLNNVNICDTCSNDSAFSFISKVSKFDSFILIESPSSLVDFTETNFDGVKCANCDYGLIGVS